MKQEDVIIGGVYSAKVSDKLVPVRIERAHASGGGWEGVNLQTNKKVRIKTAQRLRARISGPTDEQEKPAEPEAATPEAVEATTANAAVPKPAKTKRASGLDAAVAVLKDAKEPMGCREIVQAMLDKGLWASGGKTPHATLYAAIIREIAAKGDQSRFEKVDRGRFVARQSA